MNTLHFDIRDIFRVIRLGWSGKKIWVALCGLVLAYVGYSVFVLFAHMTAGATMGSLWLRYGLFPGAKLGEFGPLGTFLWLLAMLFAVAVVYLSTCMLCKITYQQLRGDDFFSSGDAWKFIRGRWRSVLFGPIAVLALFVFFLVAGIVIGLVGKIPWVGELFFAVSFLPIFFSALVAVFVAIAFIVALLMSPAIVGSVGDDALEVMIQSFSLAWSQPWRMVIYFVWMSISVVSGTAILGCMTMFSLVLISWACGLFMEAKLANLYQQANMYVPSKFIPMQEMMDKLPTPGNPSVSEVWSGRILGIMLNFVGGFLIAYFQAAFASGLSLTYVILRKRKDDENLLEWEEEDFGQDDESNNNVASNEEDSGDSTESTEDSTAETDEDP